MAVRPRFVRRPLPWRSAVALAVLGLVPPEELRAALAAAAGTLFEAFPFVLAGALFPRGPVRWVASVAGCGCPAAPGSAALSLPAFALCWFSFGAPAAVGRVLWIVLLERGLASGWARSAEPRGTIAPHRADEAPARAGPGDLGALASDAVAGACSSTNASELASRIAADMERLALAAVLGAVILEFARSHLNGANPVFALGPFALVAFVIGAAVGAALPCATAGIALAGTLRAFHPAFAFGLLATAGLGPMRPRGSARLIRPAPRFGPGRRPRRFAPARRWRAEHRDRSHALALAGIAAATFALVLTGDRGFVNHRLTILIALAAPIAVGISLASEFVPRARSIRASRGTWLAPALLGGALVFGSPLPSGPVVSSFGDGAPGDRVALVGRARDGGRSLVRALITCCRADARLVGLALSRRARYPDGTWLAVDGTLIERDGGLELDARHVRSIPPPRDPFAYL